MTVLSFQTIEPKPPQKLGLQFNRFGEMYAQVRYLQQEFAGNPRIKFSYSIDWDEDFNEIEKASVMHRTITDPYQLTFVPGDWILYDPETDRFSKLSPEEFERQYATAALREPSPR